MLAQDCCFKSARSSTFCDDDLVGCRDLGTAGNRELFAATVADFISSIIAQCKTFPLMAAVHGELEERPMGIPHRVKRVSG